MADPQDDNVPHADFTMFVTMTQARAWNDWDLWRRWKPMTRSLDLRLDQGKRVHLPMACAACAKGIPMSEQTHIWVPRGAPRDQPESYIRLSPEEREAWLVDEAIIKY
jgi:hypothetical protein